MTGERTIYEVLSHSEIDFSSYSWNGYIVYGDAASIREVHRLHHQDSVIEYLRKELEARR